MKKIYALLLLGFLSKSFNTHAQKIELTVKSDYKNKLIPVTGNRASEKVNDNLFLMFRETDKKKAAIVGYDATTLAPTFSIPLEHGQYSRPLFKYNAETSQVFVIESYARTNIYTKKGHGFKASVYDLQGKLVKTKDVAIDIPLLSPLVMPRAFKAPAPALAPTVFSSYAVNFSENGKYLYTLENSPKKGKGALLTVYDINLEEVVKREVKTSANEDIEASAITNDGEMILVLADQKEKATVLKLDAKGKDASRIALKHQLANRETFGNYNIKIAGARVLVTAEKNFNKSELMAIHVYDVDFATRAAKLYASKEFDKGYVAQLYGKVNDKDVLHGGQMLSKKFDRPKTIKSMNVKQILVDGSTIYLVSEAINNTSTTRTTSMPAGTSGATTTSTKTIPLIFAEDILITKFEGGVNTWNSVIGRNFMVRDMQAADMTHSIVNQNSTSIHLITSESSRDKNNISAYARTIDKTTGEVSSPKRINEGKFVTFSNFACWLSPDQVVLFRTNKIAFGKGGYSLEKVSLN
ncbi:hypothetical protein GU926_11935 [Nibribacter ruber]|uniref:Uncharacterized protein n=1 Tax=Nibribacter ruber TaxID=2698458 RepID=A0A6P1P1Y8_9BACT|nr:hypothetical protein [Nibribacter ruber]QHL88102.1 hypothetical protein GU926_11935 [Nibribacter ruber]